MWAINPLFDAFHRYHWPGNIRELENVLTKAVALSPADIITLDQIPPFIAQQSSEELEGMLPVNTSLDEMEKNHVLRVLNSTNWHKGESCKILGILRPWLRRIIKQHKLKEPNGAEQDELEVEEIASVVH